MWHRGLRADWYGWIVLFAALGGRGVPCPAFDQPLLVKEGQPLGELVLAEHPPRMAQLAAIELLIEPQVHSYYQIAINPAGAVVDADRKERLDTLWSSHAEAAVYVGDGFWSLEVRLPAAGDLARDVDPRNGLAGRRPGETYPWHFNVCRQRVRGKDTQRSAFSPTGTSSFHELMKFAALMVR